MAWCARTEGYREVDSWKSLNYPPKVKKCISRFHLWTGRSKTECSIEIPKDVTWEVAIYFEIEGFEGQIVSGVSLPARRTVNSGSLVMAKQQESDMTYFSP
jgi:hypothetical protein